MTVPPNPEGDPMGSILVPYYRVSTAAQGRSGLGLEAQVEAVATYARIAGKTLTRAYQEVESGKDDDRPELMKAMAHARRVGGTVCIAKLDRLSRNLAFLANLMEAKTPFVCCDMPEANETMVGMMAVWAQHERKAISARTKSALAAYKARGGLLGAAREGGKVVSQEARQRGSERAARNRTIAARTAYEDLLPQMLEWVAAGISQAGIAARLNADGHTTRTGKAWSQGQVSRVLARTA